MAPETKPSLSARISVWLANLRHKLLSFWQSVVSVFSKFNAPIEDGGKSVHPQDTPTPEAQRDESGPLPLVINPVANAPDAGNDRQPDTPLWEKAAVLVAFGLLVVNILLWCSTKKAADAAKSAADTAQRQIADSEVAESGRPRIEFAPVLDDIGLVQGDVTVDVIGRSELTNVGGLCSSWTSYAPAKPHNVQATDFPTGPTIYPERPPQIVCKIHKIVPQWDAVKKGQLFAGVSVAVSYRNIFGQLQVKSQCFTYQTRTGKFGPCPIPSNTPITIP